MDRIKTILVIEDETALIHLLRDQLTGWGYRVIMASNGQDGLNKIQDIEPDIVICDRNMPAMSGLELLQRLRSIYPQYMSMPFIFLTALGSAADKVEALPFRPYAYLEKPVDFDELQKTIISALNSISL